MGADKEIPLDGLSKYIYEPEGLFCSVVGMDNLVHTVMSMHYTDRSTQRLLAAAFVYGGGSISGKVYT